jgi:hypothetical protein
MSTTCVSCKTDILLENAMLLHWCEGSEATTISEAAVANSSKAEAQPLLCKNCTYICDRCKVGGCSKCVKTECCDCSIQMCRKCSDVDDIMCDCFGKCYTCGTDVSRGSGWPCGECGIWNCSDCKKSDKNSCKECGPAPHKLEKEKVEKVKTTFKCESCETVHPLEKSIRCELCNINDESEDEAVAILEEESNETVASVDSWDGKIKHLFCKKCTLKCDACEVRGCRECVEFVCCDCGYNMCYECRNNEIDCGCYGKCCSCWVDINRGSEGWPCGECEKWYCHGCRRGDNPCKECGPEPESESEEESGASLEEDEEN